MQIRPITADDVEGFHRCLDAVSREREYLGHTQAPPLDVTRKWLLTSMERGDIRLVADMGSEIIGWCDIETPAREGFNHTGELGMGVRKGYRGQGIGTALLEAALQMAEEKGLERVELDVFASNKVAISLYKKYGFAVEGRKRKARKLDGAYDDIILMALLLDE